MSECTHGPNAVCIHCLGKRQQKQQGTSKSAETPAQQLKCSHPPSMRCPKCIASSSSPSQRASQSTSATTTAAATTTTFKLPCSHGPGIVCSNCIGKSSKTPPPKCTHPKDVYCPHCISKHKAAATTATTKRKPCEHGPNMHCPNCIPQESQESYEESDDHPEETCRNHGPHGSCLECMARKQGRKLTIKRQTECKCTRVRVDRSALNAFQSYVRQHGNDNFHWMGWLLGTADSDGGITVQAIYEPKQNWNCSKSKTDPILELNEEENNKSIVWSLSNLLGLKCVGWVFSHAQRKEVLSSQEVLFASKLQSQHGQSFVSLSFSLASGTAKLEAFQVSEQSIELFKRGIFSTTNNPNSPSIIPLTKPVIAEGSETTSLDTAWLTVAVPLIEAQKESCLFATCSFPPSNRLDSPQLQSDFKQHVAASKTNHISPFSDFHFLVNISERGVFDINSDLPIICSSIVTRKPPDSEDIAGYLMLLDALCESM